MKISKMVPPPGWWPPGTLGIGGFRRFMGLLFVLESVFYIKQLS
jgi:hypothetical protein